MLPRFALTPAKRLKFESYLRSHFFLYSYYTATFSASCDVGDFLGGLRRSFHSSQNIRGFSKSLTSDMSIPLGHANYVAADHPIMLATTGYGIPASRRRVTAVWRRSWKRYLRESGFWLRFLAFDFFLGSSALFSRLTESRPGRASAADKTHSWQKRPLDFAQGRLRVGHPQV